MSILKKITVLLLSSAFISGCGGGGSSDDNSTSNTPSTLNLSTQSDVISQAQTGSTIHEKIQATNAASSNLKVGASCQPITITAINNSVNDNRIKVDTIINEISLKTGADKACWDGSKGATLECGQSCYQLVRYYTDKAKTANVTLSFKTSSANIQNQTQIELSTQFSEDSKIVKKALPLEILPTFEIRPDTHFNIHLNNTSNSELNSVFIDFSNLQKLLPDRFSMKSHDGY
ncbi:hypothetical protein [Facilibium subflavum]|uniref:hypothetical protein n=1 Tax=Facilibium subflavum TaxID=2219058 RepID=UPI000E650D8B|nr:hypothetical protein [Facilibium subflavum]